VAQLAALLIVSVHTPLQSVGVPAGQVLAHAELTQTGVPPVHAVPQAPQCIAVTVRSTHAPLQLVRPALHEAPQVPPLQVGVPLVTAGQAWPHWPQLFTSLLVSLQLPLHVRPHAPAEVQHLVHPAPHEGHAETVHAAASAGASDAESDMVTIESPPPSSPPSAAPSSALEPSSPVPASLPVCPLPSSPLSCPGYAVVVESVAEPSSWPVPGGVTDPPASSPKPMP
jgi:hypothetical protein